MFQSSFELTGYITSSMGGVAEFLREFQSSFELTGYITILPSWWRTDYFVSFQSSFELTGYITLSISLIIATVAMIVSKLFRAYGLYN